MNEINITDMNFADPLNRVITYNDILQGMQEQLSDKFYYLSLIFLAYVLLNMFVLKENARLRPYFDRLDNEKYYIPSVGSFRDLTYQIIQTIALTASLMLVMMNIIYRMGLKI